MNESVTTDMCVEMKECEQILNIESNITIPNQKLSFYQSQLSFIDFQEELHAYIGKNNYLGWWNPNRLLMTFQVPKTCLRLSPLTPKVF